jgi:hypothetical protein
MAPAALERPGARHQEEAPLMQQHPTPPVLAQFPGRPFPRVDVDLAAAIEAAGGDVAAVDPLASATTLDLAIEVRDPSLAAEIASALVTLAEAAPRAVLALERVRELTRRYEAAELAEIGLADPPEPTRLQRRIDVLWKFADQLTHAHPEVA